ncbi:melanoregulin-like [Scleropages formosus]|uniref:Melanoregulin-like n=1 Tax=Scleropages formosus TaxID=113540 RepID=A0A0N8K0D4_SCLFO|nr:melanoregulin-like [Scleropages formosus]
MGAETLQYFDREAKRRRDQETNLWSEPGDPSHSERDDDRALYNLLQSRSRARRGSQEYRRLSVDIQAMRQVRRGVKEKWKLILENLERRCCPGGLVLLTDMPCRYTCEGGTADPRSDRCETRRFGSVTGNVCGSSGTGFMAEAESLLTVSASASYDRMRNAPAARTLLHALHSETSIFNSKGPPPERYLFILDRLIYLDVAEDFVKKARRFYPKGEEGVEEEEPSATLPLLFSRFTLRVPGKTSRSRDVSHDVPSPADRYEVLVVLSVDARTQARRADLTSRGAPRAVCVSCVSEQRFRYVRQACGRLRFAAASSGFGATFSFWCEGPCAALRRSALRCAKVIEMYIKEPMSKAKVSR